MTTNPRVFTADSAGNPPPELIGLLDARTHAAIAAAVSGITAPSAGSIGADPAGAAAAAQAAAIAAAAADATSKIPTAATLSGATTVGRNLLIAPDSASARTAIGAEVAGAGATAAAGAVASAAADATTKAAAAQVAAINAAATDAATKVSAKTANLKRNLKSDFGAVGDGITDDTAAVQAWVTYCVNNGLAGYAPAGTYKLTSSINFSFRPGWSLSGAGELVTTFVQWTNNIPIFVLGSDTASLMHRYCISDMGFDYHTAQSGNTAANCIQFAQAAASGAFQGTLRNLEFLGGYYGIAVTAGVGAPWGQSWDVLKFDGGLYGGAISMAGATFGVPNNHFGRIFVDATNMVGPIFNVKGYNFTIDNIEIVQAAQGPQLVALQAGGNLTIGAFKVENGTWTTNRDLIDVATNANLRVGEFFIGGTTSMNLNIPGGSGVLNAFAVGNGATLDVRDATASFNTVTAGTAYLIKSGGNGKVKLGKWRTTAATFALQNATSSSTSDNIVVEDIANTHISYDKGDSDYTVADGDPTTILFYTALTAPRVVNLQAVNNNLFNGMRYRIMSLGAVNGSNTITIKQGSTTLGTLTSDLTSIEFASRRVPSGTSWFLVGRHDISGNVVSTAAYAPQVDVFTTSGTYTKPSWAKTVRVALVGGGGGGGSGRRGAAASVRCGGGAGGGGAKAEAILSASDVTATVTVTVGTAGAGATGQATDSTDGTAGAGGGISTFGTYIRAAGGGGGGGGTTGQGIAGSAAAGQYSSTPGGAASVAGGAGGGGTQPGAAGGGGGAGGGVTSADVVAAGGSAFEAADKPGSGVASGGSGGGAGGNANNRTANEALGGGGGGGGGASITSAAGVGGAGGNYGGGGGGGGAALNGNVSGGGGNGAPGIIVVFSS